MDAMLNGSFGQVSLHTSGLTIGRAPDNQLVIGDVKASSHHAQLNFNGQGYNLTDIGSTNGTFVNEQRLERNVPNVLSNGDVIRIGDTAFSYVITGVQEIAPTVNANAFQSNEQYNATIPAPQPFPVYQQAQVQPGPSPYVASAAPSYPPQAQYPQRPYPAQPYPQQPPAQPYPPAYGIPPKRSLTWLWITLGVGGAVVIGIFILVVAVAVINGPSASKTLDNFCSAIVSGDYHTAYSDFSPGLQAQVTEQAFIVSLSTSKVTSCTHDTPVVNGSTATANLTLVSSNQSANNGTAKTTLTQDSDNTWKISNLQAPSGGSSTILPTPGRTLDVFCSSMLSKDYHTAYGTLSSTVQSQLTEQEFAASLVGSQVTTCTHDTPATTGTHATSNLTMDFDPPSNNGTGVATLVQDIGGDWKISVLAPPQNSDSSTPTPAASSV